MIILCFTHVAISLQLFLFWCRRNTLVTNKQKVGNTWLCTSLAYMPLVFTHLGSFPVVKWFDLFVPQDVEPQICYGWKYDMFSCVYRLLSTLVRLWVYAWLIRGKMNINPGENFSTKALATSSGQIKSTLLMLPAKAGLLVS